MAYIEPDIDLKKLIWRQKKLYKTFIPVWCMVVNRTVKFNMQGFEHLHVDGRKHMRPEADAKKRLFLLKHAPKIITQSRMVKVDIKQGHQTFSGKREVYHELYMKVGANRPAVVVTLRTIGAGDTHFYGMRYVGKKKRTA